MEILNTEEPLPLLLGLLLSTHRALALAAASRQTQVANRQTSSNPCIEDIGQIRKDLTEVPGKERAA